MANNFQNSLDLFKKAKRKIPLASQTFSKSQISYNFENGPIFLDRGRGAFVWDIDGNKYLDYVIGLLPNILGYNDIDVNRSIVSQLKNGISFSMPTKLEYLLAEMLIDLVPSAEMVRFAKNGSDVTSAAIRLARAYTKRDKIITCGYHSWHDWYIGTTEKDEGVPESTKKLTIKTKFNDFSSLKRIIEENNNEIAGLIIEPEGMVEEKDNFLNKVRKLTKKKGIVLIFDEIVSGFRSSIGGAQKKFGITPDLTTLGKAMANGMPLAALVGKKEIMKKLENIFFSATSSGETLSIAASIATIKKIREQNVVDKLIKYGKKIKLRLSEKIQENDIQDLLDVRGPDWRPFIYTKESQIIPKDSLTLLLRDELIKKKILFGTGFNLCLPHISKSIEEKTIKSFNEIFFSLKKNIKAGKFRSLGQKFEVRNYN